MLTADCQNEEKLSNETVPLEKDEDIVGKFIKYRLDAESTEKKLKEAEIINEQLQNEINLSRSVEKNLRNQIASAQKRLIQLHEFLNKFTIISDKQRENEKTSQAIDEKVKELEALIKQAHEQTQTIFNRTSEESDLMRRIEELKSALRTKESECDLIKTEMETMKKGKGDSLDEYIKKIENLTEALEESKRECTHCDEALAIYKKQLEENERKIEKYEEDRKHFLKDFTPKNDKEIKNVEENEENFNWTEDAAPTNTGMRSSTPTELFKNTNGINHETETNPQLDEDELGEFELFKFSTPSQAKQSFGTKRKNSTCYCETSEKVPKLGVKPKPQLDFLTQTQNLSFRSVEKTTENPARRLFSTNCNHYIQ